MGKRIKYYKGDKIGKLIYLHDVEPHILPCGQPRRRAMFDCPFCDSKPFVAMIDNVRCGKTASCGCSQEKLKRPNSWNKHRLYGTYIQMINRCTKPHISGYKGYGGRGIKVHKEWIDNVWSFYEYAMSLPNALKEGHTIDREDTDLGYFPGNIRWADKHTQAANKSKQSNNTSGFIGVNRSGSKWGSHINYMGNKVFCEYHDDILEAVWARNNFIIDNELWEYPIQTPCQ